MLEAAGCGCTDVGCEDVFEVAFTKVSTAWEPGSYVVSIVADGEKNSCTFAMPAVADPVCTSNLQVRLLPIPISDPSNEVRGLRSVLVFGTPMLVQVTVARDGVPLGTNVFSPSYSVEEPNGPLCGPTCHLGASKLSVN